MADRSLSTSRLDFGYRAAAAAAAGCSSLRCLSPNALLMMGILSQCLAKYSFEWSRLRGEDGIEHGPRHCTSLGATDRNGTQIRSEKGRLHNERQKEWSWLRTGQGCKADGGS